MTTPYNHNGFLDGPIHSWILRHREQFEAVFEEAKALNRHCHEFIDGLRVDLGNEKQIVTSVLFARLLELYQGAFVIAERGLTTPLRILFRTFLEAFFHHAAIHIDATYLNEYLNQFYVQRKKLINRLRKSTSPRLDDLRQGIDEALVSEIERTINEKGARRVSVEEVARRAHLHDVYVTVYEILSRAIHTSASDLESHIRFCEKTGKIQGSRYGPSSEETRRVLCLMGMWLAEALEQVSNTFGEDRKAMCVSHKDKFQQLLRCENSEEHI